jgi:hypothetical protein
MKGENNEKDDDLFDGWSVGPDVYHGGFRPEGESR